MSLSFDPMPSDSVTNVAALMLSTSKFEIVLLSASMALFVSVCPPSKVTFPVPPVVTVAAPLESKLKTLFALTPSAGIVSVCESVFGSATAIALFSILSVASITACDNLSNSALIVSAKNAPDCSKSVVLARLVSLTSVTVFDADGALVNVTVPVPDVPESKDTV